MYIYLNEMKKGKISLIVWSLAMAAMLVFTVLLFPLMEPMMDSMMELYESMGIPMEEVSIDFMTYISSEFSSMLTLGGAVFAGITAISVLSGEERGHTAEFLFSHPISRTRVAAEKLLFVYTNIFVFTAVCSGATLLSALAIGEGVETGKLLLLFFACFAIQICIASVCFLFSAVSRMNGIGFALGFSLLSYVLLAIAAFSDQVNETAGKILSILYYVTPFSMCSTGSIIDTGSLAWKYWIVWPVLAVAGVILAFIAYRKKDIYC